MIIYECDQIFLELLMMIAIWINLNTVIMKLIIDAVVENIEQY